MHAPARHRYTPFYCEENIWHLAQSSVFGAEDELHVVFISNEWGRCPLWNQRASLIYGEPVVWDYHVVLLRTTPTGHHEMWDMDTLRGYPLKVAQWWAATFPHFEQVLPEFLPCFRVIAAEEYVAQLCSDRSHMLDEQGEWRAPPPSWPKIGAPGAENNLPRFIDMTRPFLGEVLDAAAFRARFMPRR